MDVHAPTFDKGLFEPIALCGTKPEMGKALHLAEWPGSVTCIVCKDLLEVEGEG